MAWTPGTQLHNNKYKIIKELGQGRFVINYLAQQQDGKNIVIKTLNQNLLNQISPDERNKIETDFADEARKLEKCQHPHIVSVIEIFKHDESWCIALEYIPGDTLACFTKRMLPEKEAIGYIRQIGEALKEVHSQGLLHRDVKPLNIMVRASKYEAVLIDFGLAREIDNPLTSRGNFSEGFAPIELYSNSQRQQRIRGAWTDIYSLAATLYVLLTGKKPVSAKDRRDYDARLIPPRELNPAISEKVNQAILHGMKLEPEDRPQTMEAWLKELGKPGIPLTWLPWQQTWGAIALEIFGVLAIFAALISGVKDGKDLFFPEKPPTAVVTPSLTNQK